MKNQFSVLFDTEEKRHKAFFVQGIVLFCSVCALMLLRLVIGFLPIENELVIDALFTIPLQIGVLVIFPFLVYKLVLKMNVKQIFSFSSIRNTKWYYYVLAVPTALCFYCLTLFVSSLWQVFIMAIGYNPGMGGDMPAQFNVWMFIASIFLTGVLPGFCEEFTNRGGALTTLRGAFVTKITIFLMAIQFGLFHQHIQQVVYTMLFGALAAFVTLKSGSLWIAVLMHFLNNSFSVFNQYCEQYGWLNGGFNSLLMHNNGENMFTILIAGSVFAAIFIAIYYFLFKHADKKSQIARIQASGGVVYHSSAPVAPAYYNSSTMQNANVEVAKNIETQPAPQQPEGLAEPKTFDEVDLLSLIPKQEPKIAPPSGDEPYPIPQNAATVPQRMYVDPELSEYRNLFKPSLKDSAFYIGAIVVTVISTFLSFFFNVIY